MAKTALDKARRVSTSLRWRIVSILIFAALLPLALAGFGSWIVFGNLLEQKTLDQMRAEVKYHADAIERYLSEQRHLLELVAASHTPDELIRPGRLQHLFNDLNRTSDGAFVDLGIIGSGGDHLAYVGPYDLHDRNYRDADWFQEVNIRGEYISDVFLGFRNIPHCIIAVRGTEASRSWILRATVNSAKFDALVKTGSLREGGNAYIVNSDGLYQTTPAHGRLLDRAPDTPVAVHPGVRDRHLSAEEEGRLQVTTWINDNRWMLVVEQRLAAIQAPVNQAIAQGAYVVLVAVIILILITFFATRHLTAQIDKSAEEREELSRAFMRSAKLASIGELTTGLAHEINNPLAIVSAEQTNIFDLLQQMNVDSDLCDQIVASLQRCQTQVQRCAGITRKMLQFGRSRETELEATHIGPRLSEIVNLMERHAKVRNVELHLEVEDDLPQVLIDPVELEQVLVNLINNAIDALPGGGEVAIKSFCREKTVMIEVTDTGVGIPAGARERIFEPFFTTKPPGKGTGLGLSVCYGIVQSWGGRIEADSAPGKGATIRIALPIRPRDTRAH